VDVGAKGQTIFANAQFVAALRVVAGLARLLGNRCDMERFGTLADRVAAAINRHLWDEERGVYVDTRVDGIQSRRVSQQGNSLVIAFDIAPRERWSRILEAILDPSRLVLTAEAPTARRGRPWLQTFDEEYNIVQIQSFWAHFLHKALRKVGMYQAMVEHIRWGWGTMLEKGATTWWEVWDPPAYTFSKCHSYAATPAYDLSTDILGVYPTAPGFTKFRVEPHPVDLEWAKGIFPSVAGDIPVSWKWEDDGFELTVEVPSGTEAEIVLPDRRGVLAQAILLNGISLPRGPIILAPGKHSVAARYR